MSKRKIIRICCVVFLLALCLLTGCRSDSTQKSQAKNLKSVFGQTEKDVAEMMGWKLDGVEKRTMAATPINVFSMQITDAEFLGAKTESITMLFTADYSGEYRLTLLYAEYPPEEDMDQVSSQLDTVWGESREEMYCSWPDRIYWPEGLWAGSPVYNQVDAFLQNEKDGKELWGSSETVADILDGKTNPEEQYASWQCYYARPYAQALKNDWSIVKEEPLITTVLFRKCDDFQKENVVIIDGFQNFIGKYMEEK